MNDSKSIFETLNQTDMSQHIKAVQGQRYIPWGAQWGELKKIYPDATFEVHEDGSGNPFTISSMGVMVKVSVTINEITHTLNFPVLNNANKALKEHEYEYKTKRGITKVDPCSCFDINTSIMRALTKCIALHGLSLYVYKDELNAEVETVSSSELQQIMDLINKRGVSTADICQAWNVHKPAQIHATNFDSFMLFIESF